MVLKLSPSLLINWLLTGKDPMIVGLPDNAVKESLQELKHF
jgi:magnesium chelatase family protein